MSELPVACSLDPAALKRAVPKVSCPTYCDGPMSTRRCRTAIGFASPPPMTLSGSSRARLDSERRCCRFLRFRVTVEPDEGPMLLELTGPEGTRDFLTALIPW